jgi:DNA-binding transcriptional MerR regulator
MKNYSVKKLAKMAGVSVRTLHHYDQMELLKPTIRTGAGYRLYGEKELLRLQQILFYKELDLPLKEIQTILDDADFDVLQALTAHKTAIKQRRNRLNTLLTTIDKTILKLKGENLMLENEDLYAGFPKEKADAMRKEAMEKYGEKTVSESENKLKQLGKEGIMKLKAEGEEIAGTLYKLMHLAPESEEVQKQIARHYAHVQQFWGESVPMDKRPDAYAGLGKLYVEDERFYAEFGESYNQFLSKAIAYFVNNTLKK